MLLVPALGLTQIIGYGTLYYSFSILAPDMARAFAWPVESVFAVFSVSLLVGGLVSPVAGRLMDRHGAARTMAAGSALAAIALAICAGASHPVLYVAGIVSMQMVSSLVLYNAAFATLVQLSPVSAQRSIAHLTLIAGFASTLFWPVTALLREHFSWHVIYLAFAALNLLVCLPLHLWISRKTPQTLKQTESLPSPTADGATGVFAPHERRMPFFLTAAGFALQGLGLAALLVHMVPLLGALGLGPSAVFVGTLFGPAQVLSRFTNMMFGRQLSPLVLAGLSAALILAGTLILIATAGSSAGAIVFALLVGFGSGLASIAQGSLPLYLFGAQRYGEMLGRLSAVRLAAAAAAPFAFALILEHYGVTVALAGVTALSLTAVAAFSAIGLQIQKHETVAL